MRVWGVEYRRPVAGRAGVSCVLGRELGRAVGQYSALPFVYTNKFQKGRGSRYCHIPVDTVHTGTFVCLNHSEDTTTQPKGGAVAEPPKLILRACLAWVCILMRTVSLSPGVELGDRDINYRVVDGQAGNDSH